MKERVYNSSYRKDRTNKFKSYLNRKSDRIKMVGIHNNLGMHPAMYVVNINTFC